MKTVLVTRFVKTRRRTLAVVGGGITFICLIQGRKRLGALVLVIGRFGIVRSLSAWLFAHNKKILEF